VAQGVPCRLRLRIFSTFGTTRVVRRQSWAPAAFTPGEIPGTHFQRLSRPQCTWFCRKEPRKKSPVTPPGIDPETVRLVAKRLNHYATPGPFYVVVANYNYALLSFWVCTQRWLVVIHRRFGKTFSFPSSGVKKSRKNGLLDLWRWEWIGCPETSLTNNQSTLHNIPVERKCHLYRAWNPK
jgi:hypothetical protein